MTQIKKLMDENRWTMRALATELNCTRYLLKHIVEHEPETDDQRRLAESALKVLKKSAGGISAPPKAEPIGIPLYGEIPAGPLNSVEGQTEPESYVRFDDLDPRKHFAMRVHGSSMEPVYLDDDIVICRRVEGVAMPVKAEGPTPVTRVSRFDGRVVCALIDDSETTLKRLEICKTGANDTAYLINLRPLNPNHPIVPIGPNNSFAVQGEVVRIIRDV